MVEETKEIIKMKVVPIRILLPLDEYKRLKRYADRQGRSMSREIRDALSGNIKETCNYISELIDSANPDIIEVHKGGSERQCIAVYLTEKSQHNLEYVSQLLSPKMPLIGRDTERQRGQRTFILRMIIADILDKRELVPDDRFKRVSKRVMRSLKAKEPEKKSIIPPNMRQFSFKVREFFRPDLPTVQAISNLAKMREITISELYHSAIEHFTGRIVPEPHFIATKLVIVRLFAKDNDKIMKLIPKCTFNTAAVTKSGYYNEEDKILIANRMKTHKITKTDILRCAIYEELSQFYDSENLAIKKSRSYAAVKDD